MTASSSAVRPFVVEDLFELEDVGMYYGGPYAWSPDGYDLAFTRGRPAKTLANHKWEFLWGNAGTDVWVWTKAGNHIENVTRGEADGSGWWCPQWSPDGQKLAMLSTRYGNVHLWLWDRGTGEVRRISERATAIFDEPHERPFVWLDPRRLLFPALPAGARPMGMRIELQTPETATHEWPKVERGQEATASVLDSGVAVDPADRPQGALIVADVDTAEERVVSSGNVESLSVSPDSKAVAFTTTVGIYLPQADQPLPFGSSSDTTTIGLAATGGELLVLRGEVCKDVIEGSVRWSPSGDRLAFLGYRAARDDSPSLHLVDVAQRSVGVRDLPGLDAAPRLRQAPQLEWCADGQLLVFAAAMSGGQRATETDRRDWWLLGTSDAPVRLTGEVAEPPDQLWPDLDRRSFVGTADSALWRIEPTTAVVENLTEQSGTKVDSLTWPSMTNDGTDEYRIPYRTYRQVILAVASGRGREYRLVDLATGTIQPVRKPEPRSSVDLVAYEPATSTAVFRASDRNGLRMWASPADTGDCRLLFEGNRFLAHVAEGEFRQITYSSLNGETLKAWVLLPIDYQEGKRYPLLTSVYAGMVYGDQPPYYGGSINSSSYLNMQIPAARGYAVLFPSMPLGPEGVTDDPMLRLSDGVLPAVDQAISTGVADPNRLYLIGQSFGGFSTYGLITQTKRFHAAVALAGLSNLISLYGQLEARERYTDYPQEDIFHQALIESAQVRMGNPPWKDLGRYLRNSPIFQVDRIETPLMIIQGDLDYIAIQQGEEFFTSLYRQGKRARFVRYWGEGHILVSPANIKDFWNRTFDWLEQYSGAQ